MGRDRLGNFEELVLLACLRLGEEAYTVAVVDELQKRTGQDTSHSAVYVALRRLEEKGLVRSELGGSTPERGGRPKRYFQLAPSALPLLRESRDVLLTMWEGLEGVS